MAANAPSAQSEAYLDLLIGCISRTVIPEYYEPFRAPTNSIYRWLYACIPIRRFLQIKGLELVRRYKMAIVLVLFQMSPLLTGRKLLARMAVRSGQLSCLAVQEM